MARRRIPKETGLRLENLLDQSDEQIGQWIASICNRASDGSGANDDERVRRIAEQMDRVVRNREWPLLDLAIALALKGDLVRAGCAFRTHATSASLRFNKQEIADLEMRLTKINAQEEKHQQWKSVGQEIRESEHGRPMSNAALAKRVSKRTGHSENSIRIELPRLGLGQREWQRRFQDRVKSSGEKTHPKKRSRFGSLRSRN